MSNYLQQDPQDAFDSELYWFADHRHFQDVTLSSKGVLTVPSPASATGRLKNRETLEYLESKALITNVRQTDSGSWTYSPVAQ